jgi:pimeloyl-ACP methyl ester carboxylesterase
LRGQTALFAAYCRFRLRRTPELSRSLEAFTERRKQSGDLAAMGWRLQLIIDNDPRSIAKSARGPIYLLAGVGDIVVPWFPVYRWFRRFCPSLKETRLIRHAGHVVLLDASAESAQQILLWMGIK